MRKGGRSATLNGEPSTARLSAFGSLEGSELDGLAQMAGPERTLERDDVLWDEGKRLPALFVLLDGWMISKVTLADDREMTVKVHLPGDILGLPSLAFSTAAETAVALGPARLRPLPLHSFGRLFEAHPRVAAMMFLVSQQERMDLMDRIVAASAGDVTQRLAAFACKLQERVNRSFPDTGEAFFLPLTRRHVADLVGAKPAHLTKAVKTLRENNVLGWAGQFVTIMDATALTAIARLPARQLVHDAHWLPTIAQDG